MLFKYKWPLCITFLFSIFGPCVSQFFSLDYEKNLCVTNYGFTADKTPLLSLDLTFSENSIDKLYEITVKLYRTFYPFFPAFVYCHLNWQKIYKV